MISFYKYFKRAQNLVPHDYQKKSIFLLISSMILLILDVFSIFLLVPLIISLLKPDYQIDILSFEFNSLYKPYISFFVFLFFVVKNYFSIYLNNRSAKIAFQLSSEYATLLGKHYVLGNYTEFKKQKKSSMIKDIIFISNDFVSNFLLSIYSIIAELSLLFVILAISLYYYPSPSLIMVSLLVITLWVFKRFNHNAVKRINENRIKDYDLNMNHLTNLLNGYLSIKSPDVQKKFLNRFKESNRILNSNYAKLHAIRINTSKQTEIILILILCGMYAFLHLFSLEIDTVSFLSLFAAILFKAIPSINKLNVSITNFNSHLFTLDTLEKRVSSLPRNNLNDVPLSFNSTIRIESISFAYEESSYIFNNFSLTINKGDYIGVTGKSGIGKTSLLNIIAKLIDPNSGNLYLDNQAINNTNKHSYFRLITYLTQKPFIYEGTILENICLGDEKYDEQKLHHILEAFELKSVIEKLSKGLHTYIGIEGNVLSGGQLQRLCLTRALMNPSEILILDEATNNLDSTTEKKVLLYLKEYALKNRLTVISTAHHIYKNESIHTTIINLEKDEV